MAQHPFLCCGEWQNRSTSQQVMHIVRDGKIVWSYTNSFKGELGDCSMLSNGNIVFSRQFGASKITPDKKIVWNYDGPPGTEIHTTYPIDKDRVLIMQNGNPAKLMVIDKSTNQVEKELVLPTRVATGTHEQFRHIRMTPAGWPKIVQLIEVTPGKNVVWALRDWTTFGPASSTQLLDEPGVAEKRELQR